MPVAEAVRPAEALADPGLPVHDVPRSSVVHVPRGAGAHTRYLIAMPTGGRPTTSRIAQQALGLVLQQRDDTVVYVQHWRNDTARLPDFMHVSAKDSHPAGCYNAALRWYRRAFGRLPEVFFTMDDDVIIGEYTLDKLASILRTDQTIGLLGAWNNLAEPARGHREELSYQIESPLRGATYFGSEFNGAQTSDTIQYGPGFCVGGALHAIPKFTISLAELYSQDLYENRAREEDAALTHQVTAWGFRVAIAVTVPVAILPDDTFNPWYRSAILRLHYMRDREGFPPEYRTDE